MLFVMIIMPESSTLLDIEYKKKFGEFYDGLSINTRLKSGFNLFGYSKKISQAFVLVVLQNY